MAVTMASAKKVRRQKILKIFYLNVLVKPKELLCGRQCEKSPVEAKCFLSTRNCLRRMSAPMRYNLFIPAIKWRV